MGSRATVVAACGILSDQGSTPVPCIGGYSTIVPARNAVESTLVGMHRKWLNSVSYWWTFGSFPVWRYSEWLPAISSVWLLLKYSCQKPHQMWMWNSKADKLSWLWVKWKPLSRVWLFDPTDYTVHGILQARMLEWVAFPFSRRSSQPRDWIQVSFITGGFFTSWVTRAAQEYWSG